MIFSLTKNVIKMKTQLLKLKLIAFIMGLLLVNAGICFTQTTRTTKQDGLWSDPNTWTGGVIPDASNKATINSHVIIDIDVNILSLTISAASSLTFDTTAAIVFTVADEIVVNGLFSVAMNKVSPLKHTLKVGADFYGPGDIDFYEPKGDVVELVFIGNSNSLLRDIQDVTGVGGNGKFGGITVDKTIIGAVVTLKKSLTINSGAAPSLQCNVTVKKGVLDFDSCYVSAGDNTNKLEVDSLGKLYIASDAIHSGDGFEEYVIHPSSTVKYYNDDDYEMTKGWTAFDGKFGNLIVSGNGTKFFGDSVASRTIIGNLTIETDANFSVDNDMVEVKGLALIDGTLSSDNKHSSVLFDSLVIVSDDGAWQAKSNDMFIFENGLNVSDDAEFSSGTGNYLFTANNQEIFLHDTILNIEIDNVDVLSNDSLTCNVLQGSGALINNYWLDFTGQTIQCNLGLDSANNKIIYSNNNPDIAPLVYENIEIRSTGKASLAGDVTIKNRFIKNNDGLIDLGDYDLVLDTMALLQIENPASNRMIVTEGEGSLIVRSKTADRFRMVYPVGTLTNTAAYTPFEITNTIKHPGGIKYLSVKAAYGQHPGMEDTTGLLKYWTIGTDMLPSDSITADIKFLYADSEIRGIENDYEVRYWTGNEPWIEPNNWSIDPSMNIFTVSGVNAISYDWTAGDSTAITSKINDLEFSVDSGIYFNAQDLSIVTSTPDVKIYFTLDGTIPDSLDILYTVPLTVDSSVTVSAIAYKDGWQNSDIMAALYTFKVDTIKFNKASGTYTGKQTIEMTSNTLNAEIRYTLDGTDPDETAILYTGPVEIDTAITIKAIGLKDKYLPSSISTADYVIVYDTVDAPAFSLAGGDYYNEISVTITTDTLNTEIYYAFGDTIPDKSMGRLYTSPLLIDKSCTINAIAYKEGLIESAVVFVVYNILETSISENLNSDCIDLYPVPAANIVKIDLGKACANVVLSLYDLNGVLVYSNSYQSTDLIELDLSDYKPGLYNINLNTANHIITLKLIKQ